MKNSETISSEPIDIQISKFGIVVTVVITIILLGIMATTAIYQDQQEWDCKHLKSDMKVCTR